MCHVEGEVELENVHARFTKKAKLTALGVRGDERANVRLRHPSFLCDAWHLEIGGRRRQVRIEPGRRGGHQVDRDRRAGVLLARRLDVGGNVVDELLVGRPELRARRVRRVVAGPRGRGPRAKVPWRRNPWPMIREPTIFPFCSISWPFALSGNTTWAIPVIASG